MTTSATFSDFSVRNQIVAITGGGAGIGLAYARLAHRKGAKVLVADLQLHKDAQDLHGKNNFVFVECDVTKWPQLENIITISKDKYGAVPDVYIASAGVFETPRFSFWDDVESDRYAIFDVNVNHPIRLTRIAIRTLLGAHKNGVVVIVASIAGYSAQYPAPLYSASKHAVVGFTKSMTAAQEMQGVKVTALCPGIVSTPLWNDNPDVKDRFSVNDDISITAERVAESLDSLVEGARHSGGTILEVSQLGERVIPEWGIQPPGLVDGEMAEGTDVAPEAMQKALAPILEQTQKERGGYGNN